MLTTLDIVEAIHRVTGHMPTPTQQARLLDVEEEPRINPITHMNAMDAFVRRVQCGNTEGYRGVSQLLNYERAVYEILKEMKCLSP